MATGPVPASNPMGSAEAGSWFEHAAQMKNRSRGGSISSRACTVLRPRSTFTANLRLRNNPLQRTCGRPGQRRTV